MKKALLISISIMMLTVLISCNGNSAPAPSEADISAVRDGLTSEVMGNIIKAVFSEDENVETVYSIEENAAARSSKSVTLIGEAEFRGYQPTASLTVNGTLTFSLEGNASDSGFTGSSYTIERSVLRISPEGGMAVGVTISGSGPAHVSAEAYTGTDGKITTHIKDIAIPAVSVTIGGETMEVEGTESTPPEEDPGTGSPEAETAPVPVFLTGIQQQANPLMLLSEGSNEEAGMSEEMCYMFYKLFVGAPAIVGFEGNTSDKEISTTIFDSPVTFSWNEENGVYTYEGTDGKTISATIIYNSMTQSYDYQQVIKSSYASQDYYVISMASDVQYSKETGWDGNYKAYISGGPAPIDGGQYYMFNNICFGTFHSDDNATGVFTYKMIQDFKSNDTLEADSDKLFSYDTTIDQASGIVSKMEEFMTPSDDTGEKDIRSNYSYQILYSRNGRYEVYPPTNGPETDPEEQRAACLEYLPQISGNWQMEDSDIPHPSAQVDA